jgi:hypothetical protein
MSFSKSFSIGIALALSLSIPAFAATQREPQAQKKKAEKPPSIELPRISSLEGLEQDETREIAELYFPSGMSDKAD